MVPWANWELLAINHVDRVNRVMSQHLETMYMAGEILALKSPSMLLLPGVMQSLSGWQKPCPPRSRLPIPYEAVAYIAEQGGMIEEALCVLLSFALYLRPSEGTRLRKKDLVKPVAKAGDYQYWKVVLHPLKLQNTGVRRVPGPGPALPSARETSGVQASRTSETKAFMAQSEKELGLEALGELHLYRLRHGGASHDYCSRLRDLSSIQMRGQWKSQSSMNSKKGAKWAISSKRSQSTSKRQ